ncbi:unnamed protein product [Dovyalis caffra]|uniref:CRIB domain-containing protein n=1 Tax=Dovyalis caffra TaxID=77055 RepID=A0AAV1S6B2_9ROSI|nr:unnamed protein product [Dovyalis caffra]
MKGLLRGLRYISQIFDNDEKEPEMQIGYPTDVKHVAHIGWDGPSVNSPSWMNEFKAPTPFSSAPLSPNGDVKEDGSVKWVSEGSSRRGSRTPSSPAGAHSSPVGSPTRDLPELPKSSRRPSSTGTSAESLNREKSDKPKQTRRSSRNGTKELDGNKTSRNPKDHSGGIESPSDLPDIPKKNRRKKSKDSSVGGSTRSKSKAPASEGDGESEMTARSSNSHDQQRQTGALSPSRDGEEIGFSGIS